MKYEFLFSTVRICNGTVTIGFSAQIQNLGDTNEKSPIGISTASAAFAEQPKNESVARSRACCIS
jgi:hypothetical protein